MDPGRQTVLHWLEFVHLGQIDRQSQSHYPTIRSAGRGLVAVAVSSRSPGAEGHMFGMDWRLQRQQRTSGVVLEVSFATDYWRVLGRSWILIGSGVGIRWCLTCFGGQQLHHLHRWACDSQYSLCVSAQVGSWARTHSAPLSSADFSGDSPCQTPGCLSQASQAVHHRGVYLVRATASWRMYCAPRLGLCRHRALAAILTWPKAVDRASEAIGTGRMMSDWDCARGPYHYHFRVYAGCLASRPAGQ